MKGEAVEALQRTGQARTGTSKRWWGKCPGWGCGAERRRWVWDDRQDAPTLNNTSDSSWRSSPSQQSSRTQVGKFMTAARL